MAEPTGTSRVVSPTFHTTCIFTTLVFFVILIGACVLRVEIVASGVGKIIPTGRVQVIQPEFSGRITAIHVDNGSQVNKGDVLLTLDATEAETVVGTVRAEIDHLETEALRIALFLDILGAGTQNGKAGNTADLEKFKAPDSLQDQFFFDKQKRLLKAEIDDLNASLKQFAARILAHEKSAEVTRANISRIESALEIQRERLEATQVLIERGTTSKANYLDVLEVFTKLQKERDVLVQELHQKIAQTGAVEAERSSFLTTQTNKRLQRRSEIDSRLAALRQQERAAERRINVSRLPSPVSGTVNQLRVFTIGGVAEAGETLMQVVPNEDALEIEARFANEDIGFLKTGQKVRIKLDAFPAERFGAIDGTVAHISADAVQSPSGDWAFVVHIKPQASSVGTPAGGVDLRPGMTARIDAITGERTLISYFLEPLTAQLTDSLRER